MPGYTIINFPAKSSNQDVQIAGNFTNWQPQVMKYNDSVSRFEYKVNDLVDGSTNGKYNFKFIINGEWRVDKEYPSEFDPSGNENNVILYDYTDDKSASDEYISKLKTEVTQDNEEGPKTPDPTPYNLSTTTTNVRTNSTSDATTATAIATGILPVTEPPTESNTLPAHDKESTFASKAVPKTEPSNGSSQFIPLTETSTEQAPKSESLSIPEPEPVKRAEPPTKTKEPEAQSGNKKPSGLKADDKPSVPKPVDRSEPPKQTGVPKTIPIIPESSLPITTNTEKKSKDDSTSNTNSKTLKPSPSPAQDQPFSDTNESGEGYEDASNQLQEHRPASNPYSNSGKDIPQYSIGFFATMLHVITQFFRRWFHLNSE